jgi:predicted HicB family RNase H-like nuclease
MDTASARTRFEAALAGQLTLAGEPAVEAAGQSLLAALAPAMRQLCVELAEQAATEVGAQLPGQRVEVVLADGEPSLRVRPAQEGADVAAEDYEARITLRLPSSLKSLIEDAAGSAGDSVNSWVVKSLATFARRGPGPGRRVRGTVRT